MHRYIYKNPNQDPPELYPIGVAGVIGLEREESPFSLCFLPFVAITAITLLKILILICPLFGGRGMVCSCFLMDLDDVNAISSVLKTKESNQMETEQERDRESSRKSAKQGKKSRNRTKQRRNSRNRANKEKKD